MSPPPLIGVSLQPVSAEAERLRGLARLADELGYDLLALQDHPYQPDFLDSLATLAVILGETRRIRVLPDVAVLPLRPPAMLAKTAASLDRLSDGRFVLGLGAGGYLEAAAAMGGEPLDRRTSLDAFAEAVEVIKGLWSSGRTPYTFAGRHYRVGGIQLGPPPSPNLRLWVGAHGPRMLRLIGEAADGWIPSLMRGRDESDLIAASKRIDGAAADAGRDPATIERIWNVPLRIGDGDQAAAVWVERLGRWLEVGAATGFIVWPQGPDVAEQLHRFATQVRPLLS
jgi:alkanesulfonate monooxygenase SsuD/methylene tetrahydromethanopterin reductase-like flavin-dependent oxidoreductase (luciferase family)